MTPPADPEATSPPGPGKDASAAEIEADIARTREQLGNTVEELSSKLDVKSQAQHKAREAKARVTDHVTALRARGRHLTARSMAAVSDDQGKPKPVVPVAGAAIVVAGVAVVLVVVWRRSR